MTQGGAWAIVPVKRFDRAKSRLAGLLDPGERADARQGYARRRARRARADAGIGGRRVVTSDADARAMANALGFETVADPGESGVNDAVAIGVAICARARRDLGSYRSRRHSLRRRRRNPRRLARARHGVASALAPAARDGGTNILGHGADRCNSTGLRPRAAPRVTSPPRETEEASPPFSR